MGQLNNKIAVISGAGRGQGRVAAELFATEGASVIVNDLDQEAVAETCAAIHANGGKAIPAVGDVSDSQTVQEILSIAQQTCGGIDIIYNNAGIGYSATARFGIAMSDVVNCSEADWQRILDININSVFLFSKYGIPLLIQRGGGVVINTASIAALRGGADAHAYTATKGAIVALSRAIAVTYGKNGIRANTICPGIIDTDMIHDTMITNDAINKALALATPLGRIGQAADVAAVALFLASDASAFITGETFAVDGGLIQRVG